MEHFPFTMDERTSESIYATTEEAVAQADDFYEFCGEYKRLDQLMLCVP